jgi:hypothetical protein
MRVKMRVRVRVRDITKVCEDVKTRNNPGDDARVTALLPATDEDGQGCKKK